MEDDRVGDDEGEVTRPGSPPPEVEVVAEQRQSVVKPAQLLEDVSANKHPRRVHREHLGAVMLALVILTGLETCLPTAGAADRDADLEQPAQGGPLAQFRAEHRDRRVVLRRGQKSREGRGRRGAVIVEKPDPVGRRDMSQADLDRVAVRRGGRRV